MFELLFNDSIHGLLPDEWGPHGAWATIRIGEFQENFLITLYHWQKRDYIRQWREACDSLLSGQSPVAFLVDVKDSWHRMRFSFAWVAYAESEVVHVQNVILKPYRFPRGDLLRPHCAVLPRETVSTEPYLGHSKISEWDTSLEDIAVYGRSLERLQA